MTATGVLTAVAGPRPIAVSLAAVTAFAACWLCVLGAAHGLARLLAHR